jgi:hypothetical protein
VVAAGCPGARAEPKATPWQPRQPGAGSEGEIRGAEIALDGTPIGTPGFLVSPAGEIADRPVLVPNGTDQTAALYDRFDDTPAYHVQRVRVRAIAAPE